MKIYFVLIVFLVTACASSWAVDNIRTSVSLYPEGDVVSEYHNDWTRKHYKRRISTFKANPLAPGDIVFIGDSITEKGGDWEKRFGLSGIANRGIAGDVSDGVLKRLEEIVQAKPRAVFILIGVNDLFNYHHEQDTGRLVYFGIIPSVAFIADRINKITRYISDASPDTEIFVRTVLPTRRSFLNADIVKLNGLIKQNEKAGVYSVIPFYEAFVDEKGWLKAEFTEDGVHLNEQGYRHWVKVEAPILQSLIMSSSD